MSWRLPAEEKVKAVQLYHQYGSAIQVQRMWKNYFATEPPCRQQIVQLAKKFEETGSINNKKGSGRSRSVVTEQAVLSLFCKRACQNVLFRLKRCQQLIGQQISN